MADTPIVPGDPFSGLLLNAIASLTEEIYSPDKLKRVEAVVANGVAKGQTVASGAQHMAGQALGWKTVDDVVEKLTEILIKLTDVSGHILDPMARGAIDSLLSDETSGGVVGQNAGQRLISKVTGAPTSIEPGTEGAARYATLMLHETVEAWLRGVVVELVTEFMPRLSPWGGGIENVQKLQEIVESALGGGRMMRRVLQPFVQATAITPSQWHVNKTYTPTLLGASTVIRQFARGRWDWADVVEELARQGYSEVRIDALLNEARKFFSVDDIQRLLVREEWDIDQATRHLKDAGYFDEDIQRELKLAGQKRIEAHENAELPAVIAAYVSGDIDHADLVSTINTVVKPHAERAFRIEEAELKRGVNVKHLTPGEVEQMVKAGILAFVDYRESLRRVNYTEDAIIAKELLLRWEVDRLKSIDDHRAELEADRLAEKERKAAAAAEKLAAVARARAEAQRGSEADLEDAAIRGLIPLARVEEVYRFHYDAETVRILLDRLEGKVQDYLAEQQRRKDAEQRAAARGLSIADLEAAVLVHELDLGTYRGNLAARGIAAADVDLLARTLAARLKELDAARAAREQARKAAAKKAIDLVRYESLVRRGVRTVAQYAALLRSLDFNDGAVADMVELLKLKIIDDEKARQAKADAEKSLRSKGLSLEEFRRAVILELKTRDDYAAFLLEQKFTVDRQALLLQELDDAVAEAEAARQRREEADARLDARAAPLSTIRRAARLGIVPPDRYQQRLVDAGYTDDDVAIEMELLLAEIADVQAARQQRQRPPAAGSPAGLTLEQLARAVRRGLKGLEDFRARAFELGLSSDVVDTQVRILGDELRETQLAKQRRAALGTELEAKSVSLSALEQRVLEGVDTVENFIAQLVAAGLAFEDAALLGSVLLDELGGA